MLTAEDKALLEKKGISEEKIAEQLACFEKGFPFLKLDGAASIEKGILAPAEEEMKAYLAAWYKRHPFSRSYGVILPSSLTTLLPPALGSSPHPPVSDCGTGMMYTIAAFLDS